MNILRPLFLLFALMLGFGQTSEAGPFERLSSGPLHPSQAFQYEVIADGPGGAQIRWRIEPGYYLYRDKFSARDAQRRDLPLDTPEGEARDDLNFGSVEVYPRDLVIRLSGVSGDVTLGWQGCQENGICYAPQSAVIRLAAAAHGSAIDTDIGDRLVLTEVEALRAKGGTLWVLAGFAGLGLLLAFTPCSFPMLPVLWAMLGGAPAGSRRALGIAVFYLAGMTTGFGLIGALAGWLGGGLQFMLQQPVVILTTAGLFLLLAAASLELIPLKMPQAVTQRLSAANGRRSLAGAALAGLASVLILGPCVTAPLAGGLLYIAQTGDVVLGAAALAMLGLGQGLPLMVLALFGRQMLPKSGPWLGFSRIAFAGLLAGMSIWLAARVMPGPVGLGLWALLGFALAAALHGESVLRRFLSLTFFALGLVQLAGAGLGGSDPLRPLMGLGSSTMSLPSLRVKSISELEAALAAETAPLRIVYVTAEWCVICKGLERDVFTQPEVQQALSTLPFIQADVTDFSGPGGALAAKLGVIGPPTLLFLDQSGREHAELRLTGAFAAKDLLAELGKARE